MLSCLRYCFVLMFFTVTFAQPDQRLGDSEIKKEPLKVTISAYKIELDDEGKEILVSSEEALPKDELRVVANYVNQTSLALMNVKPELLIPAGTVYLEGSVSPAPVEVKLGEVFLNWPLSEEEQVEYTAKDFVGFRWLISDLTPDVPTAFQFDISVK